MKIQTLAKLACLTLAAMASLAAQDLTITNARIIVANGGKNRFRRAWRAVRGEWQNR
jgi:hypothetical protein